MTSAIKLAIDVSPDLSPGWRAMAARSRAIQLVDDLNDCAALITDSAESAMAAADAGRHVLVLNPFGLSAEMCQSLSNSSRSMPTHIARFQPSILRVKQALDAGKLGEPGLLRIHCWDPESDNEEALSRELDLALWMFGGLPSEVYAIERAGYLQVHLGFDGGGMTMIDLDPAVPAGNEYYSLSLIGSTGAAYADDHHNMNLLMGEHGTKTLLTPQDSTALATLIDDFAVAVRDGRALSVSWSDTQASQRLAGQVRRAAQSKDVIMAGSSHA